MLLTLELEALESLGEDLYDGTTLPSARHTIRRRVRSRRLTRAGTIGLAVTGVAAVTLLVHPWSPDEDSSPPGELSDDALSPSVLIESAVPWTPNIDGQAFIRTTVIPIESDPDTYPTPGHAGDSISPFSYPFRHEWLGTEGIDVISATAWIREAGNWGQAAYAITLTNISERSLVLDVNSLTLTVELPNDLARWSTTHVTADSDGRLYPDVALVPLGSMDGNGYVPCRPTHQGDLVLLPGETLDMNGTLDPVVILAPYSSPTMGSEWGHLLDQYGDDIVLSVSVGMRGSEEGILDDLCLVEFAVDDGRTG